MTKITFINGKPDLKNIEGPGKVEYSEKHDFLDMKEDDFVFVGNVGVRDFDITYGSIDASNANFTNSKARINAIYSTLSNIKKVDNIKFNGNVNIKGEVGTNSIFVNAECPVNIEKSAVLIVPDINKINGGNFSFLSGEGRIYGAKQHAYYNTNKEIFKDIYLDFATLNNGDFSEAFKYDGTLLTLNKGFTFSLKGDKPTYIVDNGLITKAEISGDKLQNISGAGAINELHLSNGARFSINKSITLEQPKITLDSETMLILSNKIDFGPNIVGAGKFLINGHMYNTAGKQLDLMSLNNYSVKVQDAFNKVLEQKNIYLDDGNEDEAQLDLMAILPNDINV